MTGFSAGSGGVAVATVDGVFTGVGCRMIIVKQMTTMMMVRTTDTIQAMRSFWFFIADLFYCDAFGGPNRHRYAPT